jgi:hypothetical protein
MQMSTDIEQVKAGIIKRLDIQAAYAEMGLRVATGATPNKDGWLACHSLYRPDKTPSAGICLEGSRKGYYVDFSQPGARTGKPWLTRSLFDVAIEKGSACDFQHALQIYSERAGVDLPAKSQPRKIIATYDYTDASGTILYQVVRYEPKRFSQRKPDGKDGWSHDVHDVQRVLYRLPAILQADQDKPVYVVGGEKDADNLAAIGPVATTNSGGEGNWHGTDDTPLDGRHVVILPDNDSKGTDHANQVAGELLDRAASVKIINLPNLDAKGDVSDWINQGGTADQLQALADAAPVLTEPPAAITDLWNHAIDWTTDKGGAPKPLVTLIPIATVGEHLNELTGGWPRRVGDLLFTDDGGEIRILRKVEDLFGWIATQTTVFWKGGHGVDGASLVARPEFFSHVVATARAYDGIEIMPHEPQLPTHYYAWRTPSEPATGKHLSRLLAFFDNAATDEDAILIKAMFLTPAWGGLPGTRPAFAILAPDRGCGKSALSDAVSLLYGGSVELAPADLGQERFVSRLLSPDALTRRVVRADNLKGLVSDPTLEGLITATTISGHRLYAGEATRPNTLTYILTGNAIQLSRDLVERSFVIRLSKPDPKAEWRENLMGYVADHRDQILADIVAELRRPALPLDTPDRWLSWCAGVLARCTDDPGRLAVAIEQNQSRRDDADEDIEEATTIMDAIDRHCEVTTFDHNGHTFVMGRRMVEVVNEALGVSFSSRRVTMMLNGHIDADRLPRLYRERRSNGRGFVVRPNQEVGCRL